MVTRSDLRQRDVPNVVQKYRARYLKASPWVGARPVVGTAPTIPRVGALAFFGRGTPVSLPFPCLLQGSIQHATGAWGRVLFVLTEAHFCPLFTNHVWGWCRRGRVRFVRTRHPSCSPPLWGRVLSVDKNHPYPL